MMARRLALLIGNGTFDHAETFPNLRTSTNDAQDFARLLQEHGNFEILSTLVDETAETIIRAINELFSMVEQDDLVLLYYSGLGYRDRTGGYYLVARNSRPDLMPATSIPAFFIHNVMRSGFSRHKVIILDCCFSGASIEGREGDGEPLLLTELKKEAEAILVSSGMIQSPFEEEGRNSLFTQYLLHGIETGEADRNKDGEISIGELFDYADGRVRKTRPVQMPMKEVSARGSEMIIAKSPKGPIAKSPADARKGPQKADTIELNFPNAVREEKDFYGRRLERESIERTFLAGSGRPVVILGERRIGKTSLQTVTARRLATQETGRVIPLFLPPASAIRSLNDYAKEILQSLCGYLGKSLRDTGLVDERGQFQLTSLGQFMDAAARLLQGGGDTTFIVCLDEFDAVLINCAPDEADKIRGLTDHIIERSGLPLLIYFSMTRLPESIRDSYYSPGISKSEVIELGPLSQEETVEMVMGLLGDQVTLEDPAVERLFHLSGGHPYFVKLLLDRLLARYWRGAQLAVSPGMIEEIIPDATRDPRARHALDNIYKVHFSQQEQQLVLLLAERGAGVTGEELRVLGPDFMTAAKRLKRRGYLVRREEGGYDFRIKFLGWWLRDWEEFEEECERLGLETLGLKLDVDIEIDEVTRRVYVKGSPVKLTSQAYQALAFLCRYVGQLVPRDQLAEALWPEAKGDVSDAAIDATIYRLRAKLGDDARRPRYIETVPDQGFILRRAAFVQPDLDLERGAKP
jgi:hypothetical protein